MTTIVTRAGKGSPLTNTEMDANFNNLNTSKVELNVSNSGQIGLYVSPTTAIFQVGSVTHPNSGVQLYGALFNYTSPATATTGSTGYDSTLATAASAFTQGNMVHFSATLSTKGAASTITNVMGFYAKNAIAVGTNNYGFYSDINTATTTWQLYMGGTANSYFGGSVQLNTIAGVGTAPVAGTLVRCDLTALTAGSSYGFNLQGTAPATVTTELDGYWASLTTANSAFTLPNLNLFYAAGVSRGAASAITSVRGFYAANAIASGTNNYGFYSDINAAPTTWQLYMAGTADSTIQARLALGSGSTLNALSGASEVLRIGLDHPGSGTTGYVVNIDARAPSTMTASMIGTRCQLRTAAAAYTITSLTFYEASSTTLGAGSAITSVYGFSVQGAIVNDVAASTTYGVYVAINKPTNATAYGFFAAGTAPNVFGTGNAGSLVVGFQGAASNYTQAMIYQRHNSDAFAGDGAGTAQAIQQYIRLASSVTTSAYGINIDIGQANSVTTTSLFGVQLQLSKAGGASVTNAYGVAVTALPAVGTLAAAFYSNIAAASGTYQAYFSGTANIFIAGPIALLTPGTGTASVITMGAGSAHPDTSSAVSVYGINTNIIGPSTATTSLVGHGMVLQSKAAAYTVTSLRFFNAASAVLGAASTISNVYGFLAENPIAVGTNNYGFYSSINSATTTWQLYMGGTANSAIAGLLAISSTTAPAASLDMSGNVTAASWTTSGIGLRLRGNTYTDSSTGVSGTAASNHIHCFAAPAIAASNATVTVTNAATLYIAGAPTNGTNVTITNPYALYVAAGNAFMGGKFTTYNGVVTKGYGVPTVVASARSTAQAAAVAAVATYTLPASDGTFEVCANVLITTATVHSFTATVSYTDEGNTARVVTLNFSTLAGVISNAAITNAAGTVPYEGVPLLIRCKASTTITIATTGTFTTVVYNVEGLITQIA